MKLKFVAIAIIMAVFGTAEPAAAKVELAPATPWNLHYDTDSCVLRRAFGEGEQRTQLEMRRFAPGANLQTTVISKASRIAGQDFRYRFGREGKWGSVDRPFYATFGDDYKGVIFLHQLVDVPLEKHAGFEERDRFFIENDISAMELQAAAQIQSLTITRAFRSELTLKTGPLEKPVRALNECIDNLMTRWGIDPEAHKTRTRSATPVNLPAAARMIGYPPKMMLKKEAGLVNIRLDIDETGKVTQCHIQMPLSDPGFEDSSCADIQHALEFEPALDKNAMPMKSYYVTSIQFYLDG